VAVDIRWDQVAAFRLARHHLLRRGQDDLVRVCGDVCGVQSQVDSAARMSLAARMRNLQPGQVERALWQDRTLVKTALMRQTVHLVPSADYPACIAALKKSRTAAALRVMARCGAGEKDAARMDELVLRALDCRALTQPEIRAQVRPQVSSQLRSWMDRVWSMLRTAIAAGLVCYGGRRGAEVTYVRVDQWLPRCKLPAEREAQLILLRRYLHAYGPATLHDFARWAGMPIADVRPLGHDLRDELAEVEIDGAKAFLLRPDLQPLRRARLQPPVVRLLPAFDVYLLAHADKNHLVASSFYKRVYRNQGWISPVLLLDGRIAGVWTLSRAAKRLRIEVQPFEKLSRRLRPLLDEEAARLGALLGASPELHLPA
jgi:Winged helix DNA-binding domain